MCGRMTLHDLDSLGILISKHFNTSIDHIAWTKNYNITPNQKLMSILYDGQHFRAGLISWGLTVFSKTKTFFNINAKRETVQTYPYFKSLYQSKRILIILNGYYEWHDQGEYKTPYYVYEKNDHVMCLAAIYDKTQGVFGVSTLTEEPVDTLKHIHHRMPTLLTFEEGVTYLKEGILPKKVTLELTYHQVSLEVNLKSANHFGLIQAYDAFSDL